MKHRISFKKYDTVAGKGFPQRPQIEDNVGQRLGIGLAVSIGVNALIFAVVSAITPGTASADPGKEPRGPETPVVVRNRQVAEEPLQNNEKQKPEKEKQEKIETPVEEKPIERPKHEPEKDTEVKRQKHNPVIEPNVFVPPQHSPVEPENTESHSTPEERENPQPQKNGKPEPAELELKQYGGAASAGNPYEAPSVQATAQKAQPAAGSAATAVGGAVAVLASPGISTQPAPSHDAGLKAIGQPGQKTSAYVSVATIKAADASSFVVPTVVSEGAALHASVTKAYPAHTNATVAGAATLSTIGNGATGIQGSVANARELRWNSKGSTSLYGKQAGPGSALQPRYGAAAVEVANSEGTGSGLSGPTKGVAGANRGTGTATAIGGSVAAQDGIGNTIVGEVGNGAAQRNIAGSGGHAISDSVGPGGGVASNVSGGRGELNTQVGDRDGAVKFGKIGGEVTRGDSIGVSGDGPVALIPGSKGRDPLGNGPIGSSKPSKPPCDEESVDGCSEEIDLNSNVTQSTAKMIQKPPFELSDALRQRKVKGTVKARVEIKTDGSTTVTLVKTSGDEELDAAVLNYIRIWKWKAAVISGKSVASARIINLHVN